MSILTSKSIFFIDMVLFYGYFILIGILDFGASCKFPVISKIVKFLHLKHNMFHLFFFYRLTLGLMSECPGFLFAVVCCLLSGLTAVNGTTDAFSICSCC